MIYASHMIYPAGMKERILYHACEASISCGVSRISYRASDISFIFLMCAYAGGLHAKGLKNTHFYAILIRKKRATDWDLWRII